MKKIFLFLFYSQTIEAYPLFLTEKNIPELLGSIREQTFAFYQAPNNTIKALALEWDELENQAMLVMRNPTQVLEARKKMHIPKSKDPFLGQFTRYHRATLDEDSLTTFSLSHEKAQEAAKHFCQKNPLKLIEVYIPLSSKFFYIAECENSKIKPQEREEIKIQLDNHFVKTGIYDFSFQDKERYTSIKDLNFKEDPFIQVKRTSLQIYIKPKMFFNFNINDNDITTIPTAIKQKPYSTSIELASGLKTSLWNFSAQICCDISLYQKAIYLPVVLNFGNNILSFKEGSGVVTGLHFTNHSYQDITFIKSDDPQNISNILSLSSKENTLILSFGSIKNKNKKWIIPQFLDQKSIQNLGFENFKEPYGIYYPIDNLNDEFQFFNIWFWFSNKENSNYVISYAKKGIQFQTKVINTP